MNSTWVYRIRGIALILALLFCSPSYAVELKLGHAVNEKDVFHLTAERFKDVIEKT